MSSLLTLFPIVAVCIAVAGYLATLYLVQGYWEAINTVQTPSEAPFAWNEQNCLTDAYSCAEKYLVEFNRIIEDANTWVPVVRNAGFDLHYRVVDASEHRIEYKISLDFQSSIPELALFDYLSVGEGLVSLYPVCNI